MDERCQYSTPKTVNHVCRDIYVQDTDSAIARLIRATAWVRAVILSVEPIPGRKLYHMSLLVPAIAVDTWLKLQQPPSKAKNSGRATTRRLPPAGCPLANTDANTEQ